MRKFLCVLGLIATSQAFAGCPDYIDYLYERDIKVLRPQMQNGFSADIEAVGIAPKIQNTKLPVWETYYYESKLKLMALCERDVTEKDIVDAYVGSMRDAYTRLNNDYVAKKQVAPQK